MSIRRMYVKCTRCGKKYYWNPDVGKYRCPNCGYIGHITIIEKGKPF